MDTNNQPNCKRGLNVVGKRTMTVLTITTQEATLLQAMGALASMSRSFFTLLLGASLTHIISFVVNPESQDSAAFWIVLVIIGILIAVSIGTELWSRKHNRYALSSISNETVFKEGGS